MMDMDKHAHHGMHRAFTTKSMQPLLFKGWDISNVSGFIAGILFTVFLGILLEAIQEFSHFQELKLSGRQKVGVFGAFSFTIGEKITNSVFHVIRVFVAYILMLCAMTYNIWLLIAVGLGSGVGFFLIRPFVSSVLEKNNFKNKKKSSGCHGDKGAVTGEQTETMLTEKDETNTCPPCHKSEARETSEQTDDDSSEHTESLVMNPSECTRTTYYTIQTERVTTL